MANNSADTVPIPPKQDMNPNLTPAREDTMLARFGAPGPLTLECADPVPAFEAQLVRRVVLAPHVRVSGLRLAVASLQQVFGEIEEESPATFAEIMTAGLLCIRARRHNPSRYSNHSWGTAIDLFFGAGPVPQGVALTQRGLVDVFPVFNRHGWYWGAEFSGDSVDSMHFEWSDESIRRSVDDLALLNAPRVASKRKRRR